MEGEGEEDEEDEGDEEERKKKKEEKKSQNPRGAESAPSEARTHGFRLSSSGKYRNLLPVY